MIRHLILIPVLFLLFGCDPNEPDKHTPVRDNRLYHQYFVECLDKMSQMPGRQQIKQNGDVVSQCDSSASGMATTRNSYYGVDR